MPFTSAQQAKIDAAQQRNDKAKAAWQDWIQFWNTHFVNLSCYKDTKWDIYQAVSWFTPNDSSCTKEGSCSSDGKQLCKSEIAYVIQNIGNIRSAHTELLAAQANYNTVITQVDQEVNADPETKLNLAKAAAEAKAIRLKWVFAIVVVIIIAAAAFVWFKWFRK